MDYFGGEGGGDPLITVHVSLVIDLHGACIITISLLLPLDREMIMKKWIASSVIHTCR